MRQAAEGAGRYFFWYLYFLNFLRRPNLWPEIPPSISKHHELKERWEKGFQQERSKIYRQLEIATTSSRIVDTFFSKPRPFRSGLFLTRFAAPLVGMGNSKVSNAYAKIRLAPRASTPLPKQGIHRTRDNDELVIHESELRI